MGDVVEVLPRPMPSAVRKDNQRAVCHSMAMESTYNPGSPNVSKTTPMAYKSSNIGGWRGEYRCSRLVPALILRATTMDSRVVSGSLLVISGSDGVLLTLTYESPQVDRPSRGSKTVEGPLIDDSEHEVCDLEYEIRTARRVRLQWGIGQLVSLPW